MVFTIIFKNQIVAAGTGRVEHMDFQRPWGVARRQVVDHIPAGTMVAVVVAEEEGEQSLANFRRSTGYLP